MTTQNTLHLSTSWPEVKEKIKEANIEISDEDLDYTNEDDLLAHLAEKMNISPEDTKAWIESIATNKGKAS